MTKFFVSSSLKNVVGLTAVDVILVEEGINAFGIEEILYAVGILLLPIPVGTRPRIIHGNIHRHSPRVITEGIAKNTAPVHERAVEVIVVGIESCHRMYALVQILTRSLGTVEPELLTPVIGIFRPYLIEYGDMI